MIINMITVETKGISLRQRKTKQERKKPLLFNLYSFLSFERKCERRRAANVGIFIVLSEQ